MVVKSGNTSKKRAKIEKILRGYPSLFFNLDKKKAKKATIISNKGIIAAFLA
jgi:hypothetical protein